MSFDKERSNVMYDFGASIPVREMCEGEVCQVYLCRMELTVVIVMCHYYYTIIFLLLSSFLLLFRCCYQRLDDRPRLFTLWRMWSVVLVSKGGWLLERLEEMQRCDIDNNVE